MNAINTLKEIILENNYLNTQCGEAFKSWNSIDCIDALISFCGRSKKRECYMLGSDSDGDVTYVSHLYVDTEGNVKVQLSTEDTDDINVMIHPNGIPVEEFDDATIREWIDLLTF